MNYSNRPIYRRRRRIALLVIGILLLVALFLVSLRACGTGGEQTEQKEELVNAPTVEQTPRAVDEQTVIEEEQDVTGEEKTKE